MLPTTPMELFLRKAFRGVARSEADRGAFQSTGLSSADFCLWHFADMARWWSDGCFQSRSGHGALEFCQGVIVDQSMSLKKALARGGAFSLGMPSAIIGHLARHLRSTRRLWPRGRQAMSPIA